MEAITNETLKEWRTALSVMHISHHTSSGFFNVCHFFLGITLVLVSALLGASIGEVIFGKDDPNGKIATAILGIVSTVFAGLQTFVNAESRSKDHHASAAAFAEARRDLEQAICIPSSPPNLNEHLNRVRKKWNAALKGAPNIPAFIHWFVRRNIKTKA